MAVSLLFIGSSLSLVSGLLCMMMAGEQCKKMEAVWDMRLPAGGRQ